VAKMTTADYVYYCTSSPLIVGTRITEKFTRVQFSNQYVEDL